MGQVSYLHLFNASRWIVEKTGLYFPEERFADLSRVLADAAGDFGFTQTQLFIDWLLYDTMTQNQFDTLICRLTIGETYFYRDKNIFQALEQHVLPELICRKREASQELRIWSVGCSTGEEPYSVAILLNRLIPDLQDWNITICATDINRQALNKASRGIYGNWAFRDAPSWLKEMYFNRREKYVFEILPHIKNMVRFFYLNLIDNVYPSFVNNIRFFDLIVCRNVLMYLRPDIIKEVIDRLHKALSSRGWLIVSPSETSHQLFTKFQTVNFPGAILYKKDRNAVSSLQNIKDKIIPSFDASLQFSSKVSNYFQDGDSKLYKQSGQSVLQKISPASIEDDSKVSCNDDPINKSPDLVYKNIINLYQDKEYDKALELLLRLLDKKTSWQNISLFILIARIYADLGNSDMAIYWCEKGMEQDKLNPDIYYIYAMALKNKGEISLAIKSLTKVIYIDPDFILAHVALGDFFQSQGRRKEASRHFRNALLLLSQMAKDSIVPGSDVLTVKDLISTVNSLKVN